MPTLDTAITILQSQGLLLLFPLAVLEGPIVTVIAAYLASLGYLNIFAVYFVVVSADLAGDTIIYVIGRSWHDAILKRWGARFGLDKKRLATMEEHFKVRGGRTLLVGKLTHAPGLMILLTAGASRMSFGPFIFFNTLWTIPKGLFFATLGYTLGYAYKEIDFYIFFVSITMLIAAIVFGSYWFSRAKRNWA